MGAGPRTASRSTATTRGGLSAATEIFLDEQRRGRSVPARPESTRIRALRRHKVECFIKLIINTTSQAQIALFGTSSNYSRVAADREPSRLAAATKAEQR